ncbi:MAG: FtsW/RodA/SpoVE family cell cycle protein [Victivallales bacterium]|nr:FtsW/RodA/SpoVE family cell cycle protein [Victivallales bacterium]
MSNEAKNWNLSSRSMICILMLFIQLWGLMTIGASGVGGSFLLRQILWCVLAWVTLGVFAWIPFDRYVRLLPLLIGVFYLPLLLVLVCGIRVNGTKGWFDLGGMFLQPSEFARVLFVLLLYLGLERFRRKYVLICYAVLIFIMFALPLVAQPDFGSLLVYGLVLAGFIWLLTGFSRMLCLGGIVGCGIVAVLAFRHAYVVRRFMGFLDPGADPSGAGWHIMQFRYAMARGGWSGAGMDQAFWSKAYLPFAQSDSAFATMVEAVGLGGGMFLLLVLAGVGMLFFRLALEAEDNKRVLVFCGALMLMVQSLIHVSVNLTMMPVTGLTFPFFSYGGSSIVGGMVLIGMLFSASRSCEKVA